jgi:hypothetical protein
LRAQRSNPSRRAKERMDCFVAARLAMTVQQSPSLRANESHECARRAQRGNPCLSVIASAAKQSIAATERKNGLLRRCAPRNDGATISVIASQRVARMRSVSWPLSPRTSFMNRTTNRDMEPPPAAPPDVKDGPI